MCCVMLDVCAVGSGMTQAVTNLCVGLGKWMSSRKCSVMVRLHATESRVVQKNKQASMLCGAHAAESRMMYVRNMFRWVWNHRLQRKARRAIVLDVLVRISLGA